MLEFVEILMFRQFWVLKLNGIDLQLMSKCIKKTLICSLGIVDFRNEGRNIGQSESTKKRRARYINDRINQYNDLSRTTKDVGKWLMRRAVTCWTRDDEDMA